MSGKSAAGTSFVDSGVAEQSGSTLPTGSPFALIRNTGMTLEGESTLVESEEIAGGVMIDSQVDTNASNGSIPWESGPDEGAFTTGWPIMAALRAPSLTPPAPVTFTGSYVLTNDDTLTSGETGVTIVDVGSTDFDDFEGEVDFLIRVGGATAEENNRYIAVQRVIAAANNGGDSLIECVPGYTSGDAPAASILTHYGTPMTTVTEALTLQVGSTEVQHITGAGLSRCFGFVQRFSGISVPRYHSGEAEVIGDLTATVVPGSDIAYEVSFAGGKSSENLQSNPAVPAAGGDYDNGAILVDGVVAAGATSLDMDAGLASGTIAASDVFTVAGVPHPFTFTAPFTATAGAITGATFEPPAPAGGFANDVAVAIIHGESFTPTAIVPVAKSISRGDGNPGGLKICGIVTRNTSVAVLLTCDGSGGLTGASFTLAANNSRIDDDTCVSPESTTRGTLAPTATVDMNLVDDPTEDRPGTLTKLGRTGTKEKARFDLIWEFPLEDGETSPAAVGWHFPNSQSDAFNFTAGTKDGTVAGTMALSMSASKNFANEPASSVRWHFWPAI